MQFGISAGRVDDIGYIVHAENLGYDFCWVPDIQMVRSNPWAVLALAAQATRTIRLGPGVAVPGLRLAPVMANSIATINRLAPGRTFLGLGTGHTAMGSIGQPPMSIAAFRDYIHTVRALINGEEVEYTLDGITHPIRFADADLGYIDVEHRIPIHVGGFGPRAQALAGEVGDALITAMPRGGTIPQALENANRGAARAGRTLENFDVIALVNVLMLEPGEALDSPSVIDRIGPAVLSNILYAYNLAKATGKPPPDYVLPIWDSFVAYHESSADRERNEQRALSHSYGKLDPSLVRFVTPEVIRNFAVAGSPDEIAERLRDLESHGLDAVVFIVPVDRRYRVIEDFAREVMARM